MNIAKAKSWRCPDLLSGAQTSGSLLVFTPDQPGKGFPVRSGAQCPVQWQSPSLPGGHSTVRQRKRNRILRRPWDQMRTWLIVTDCWGLLRDVWSSSRCGSHDLISQVDLVVLGLCLPSSPSWHSSSWRCSWARKAMTVFRTDATTVRTLDGFADHPGWAELSWAELTWPRTRSKDPQKLRWNKDYFLLNHKRAKLCCFVNSEFQNKSSNNCKFIVKEIRQDIEI